MRACVMINPDFLIYARVFLCLYVYMRVGSFVRVYYSENQLQTMDMLAGLVCPYCYCPNEDRLSDDSTKVSQCYAATACTRVLLG